MSIILRAMSLVHRSINLNLNDLPQILILNPNKGYVSVTNNIQKIEDYYKQWRPYLSRLWMDEAIYNCLAGALTFTSAEGYMYEYSNIHEIKDYYI